MNGTACGARRSRWPRATDSYLRVWWTLKAVSLKDVLEVGWQLRRDMEHNLEGRVRSAPTNDGTLWLNIGDSYASGGRKTRDSDDKLAQRGMGTWPADPDGLKPKDLIGIPWMLARALRDPYYTGPVKDVCDQVWLAAMMDAEGSICGTEYQSGDRIKTNIYISITNTSVPVIEKCDRLFPQDLKHIASLRGAEPALSAERPSRSES